MTITTNNSGFTEASLDTGSAELHACYGSGDFRVVTDSHHFATANGWYFNEESCREAAEFFIKLADELKRRKEERE